MHGRDRDVYFYFDSSLLPNRSKTLQTRRAVRLRGLRGSSPSLRFQRATSATPATPGPPFCLYPRRCSSFITAALQPDEQLFIGTAACKIGCKPAVRTNLYAGRRRERESLLEGRQTSGPVNRKHKQLAVIISPARWQRIDTFSALCTVCVCVCVLVFIRKQRLL